MKRVNAFEVVPQTENDKECLLRLLDASATLWNELTYERRQTYFGDGDVWDTSEYRGRYRSRRIRRLYRQRTKRRAHAQNALVRNLVERLYDEGVATVYVGDLTDVLETHWSVSENEKTHNFWALKEFINRLACVCEEYGISLEAESDAWTSQTRPGCGDHEGTVRHEDTLTCPCGFEGHADLTASETFLRENSGCEIRPMARPVRFEWDDHDWSGISHPRESPKEVHTNPQVASMGRYPNPQRRNPRALARGGCQTSGGVRPSTILRFSVTSDRRSSP